MAFPDQTVLCAAGEIMRRVPTIWVDFYKWDLWKFTLYESNITPTLEMILTPGSTLKIFTGNWCHDQITLCHYWEGDAAFTFLLEVDGSISKADKSVFLPLKYSYLHWPKKKIQYLFGCSFIPCDGEQWSPGVTEKEKTLIFLHVVFMPLPTRTS